MPVAACILDKPNSLVIPSMALGYMLGLIFCKDEMVSVNHHERLGVQSDTIEHWTRKTTTRIVHFFLEGQT